MEGVFGIIWVIAIVAMIVKSAKKANGNAAKTTRPQAPYQAPQNANAARPRQLTPAQQSQQIQQRAQYTSQQRAAAAQRAVRETNQDRYGAATTVGSSFGQVKTSRIGESGVLLEDRKNDWLAKQLREEAVIYRRGVGFDLGASHNVNCAADDLKRGHIRVHNSNGLDRQTFR